jgi:hypothetical protein
MSARLENKVHLSQALVTGVLASVVVLTVSRNRTG